MRRRSPLIAAFAVLLLSLTFTTPALADPAFAAVAKHLKTRYNAKERHIPFMGLAKFAIKFVRPAGVKSMNLMVFENLKYRPEAGNNELDDVLRSALSNEWQPLVKVFSRREGQQTFVYAREEGKNVRLMVVAIEQEQATLVRVKLSPETLVKWMDNPKILGISLGGAIR
jgi:hypothetical protein